MVNPPSKLRILLDANILLSGCAYPRWPYEVLLCAVNGDFIVVLSPLVVEQARRHLIKRFPQHLHRLDVFLQSLEFELVPDPLPEEVESNKELVRDLSDVPIALAAIKGQVDFLVTTDRDLTVQDQTTENLRQRLRVILPGTFLREVIGWTSEQLENIRHRDWDQVIVDSETSSS